MFNYWDTYAWVLLDNHFHLVVKIKSIDIVIASKRDFKRVNVSFIKKHQHLIDNTLDRSSQRADLTGFENLLNLAIEGSQELLRELTQWAVSERFRRFLLGYAKAINKQQSRTGSLFQTPFRRKVIETDKGTC